MAWYDGAVFYQILPGAVLSDVAQDENARSNVKELEEFLSYLKVLGCDGIILGPVFSKDPMRYGTGDFLPDSGNGWGRKKNFGHL